MENKFKLSSHDVFSIPNLLSVVRILLVPLFAYFYFCDFAHHYAYSAATLILSGFTDVLDGFIARHFNMITTLGKLLDPVADKLTQGAIVACLALNHSELVPFLVLLFAKELTMLLGAVKLFKMGARPSESKWWGKMSTCMVYLVFLIVLIFDMFPAFPEFLIYCSEVLASICLVFSLFNYYPIFKGIQTGDYDVNAEKNSENQSKK